MLFRSTNGILILRAADFDRRQSHQRSNPAAIAAANKIEDENDVNGERNGLSIDGKLPLKKLLEELTDRGIPFSPSASKKELEELLSISRGRQNGNLELRKDNHDFNLELPEEELQKRPAEEQREPLHQGKNPPSYGDDKESSGSLSRIERRRNRRRKRNYFRDRKNDTRDNYIASLEDDTAWHFYPDNNETRSSQIGRAHV